MIILKLILMVACRLLFAIYNMIDMLNCKNKFSKHKFNTALMESNYFEFRKTYAAKFENYITTLLCDAEGISYFIKQ